ncbi:ATP-binding cassette domain-containing protein [Prevotella jejuni]|uniref:ATP-binding cassette domain-containing protein n=1 Tax=Prevotella jejuni TaxID=1177574 RepID=UPI0027E467B3|nr:ATP-binding cassette domain-containing protein [Prevotella jejuni]
MEELEKGQCIGFVGPNGCGKTTLMKCILGLATPQSGEVIVKGMNIQDNPSYRQHIGLRFYHYSQNQWLLWRDPALFYYRNRYNLCR